MGIKQNLKKVGYLVQPRLEVTSFKESNQPAIYTERDLLERTIRLTKVAQLRTRQFSINLSHAYKMHQDVTKTSLSNRLP